MHYFFETIIFGFVIVFRPNTMRVLFNLIHLPFCRRRQLLNEANCMRLVASFYLLDGGSCPLQCESFPDMILNQWSFSQKCPSINLIQTGVMLMMRANGSMCQRSCPNWHVKKSLSFWTNKALTRLTSRNVSFYKTSFWVNRI